MLRRSLEQARMIRPLFIVVLMLPIPGVLVTRESFKARVHAQERLRIVIEEVQLPVAAYDNYGHFDPSVVIDDLLVLENGVPQEVRSVRHIPASVVLLLDTGGEINTAKSIRITRDIAKKLVLSLDSRDQISVLQFNDKVELLQDWTQDFKQVARMLETKLLSGKRAHFSAGLIAAVSQFDEQPIGSRHLVVITDGVETPGGKRDRADALNRLAASNAVVHVISYTTISREATKNSRRIIRKRGRSTVPDDVVNSLPDDPGFDQLRRLHQPGGITADVDPERQRRVREYERAMNESEWQLRSLSNETGGHIWLPESFDEMIANGADTAHLIDSEYVVTYKPKRAVASATQSETRRIEVISRRVGLNVVARRRYIVLPSIRFSNGRRLGNNFGDVQTE